MSVFQGVQVNKVGGGLQRKQPSTDGVALIIIGAGVATGSLAAKTVAKLLTLQNAEAIGIDAAYDDTNDILAHYHIDEFFRVAPQGTLYAVIDDGTLTNTDIKAIIREHTDITGIAVARNSNVAVADFPAYKAGYQSLVTDLRTEGINLGYVLVEGNVFDAGTAVGAYPDNRDDNAPDVAVVAVQDPLIRLLKPAYEGLAAVGTALGGLCVRNVNENLGSVDIENKPAGFKGNISYPLTDLERGRWLGAVLQNGVDVNVLSLNEKAELDNKAYIFAGRYVGIAGVYFSNSGTSTEITSDYAYIENNRVWNKAASLIRTALLPRVKSNVLKDAETGKILQREATDLEILASNALRGMESKGEISGSDIYIDTDQVLAQDTPLEVRAQIVSNNILFDIVVNLGQVNSVS